MLLLQTQRRELSEQHDEDVRTILRLRIDKETSALELEQHARALRERESDILKWQVAYQVLHLGLNDLLNDKEIGLPPNLMQSLERVIDAAAGVAPGPAS